MTSLLIFVLVFAFSDSAPQAAQTESKPACGAWLGQVEEFS